MKNINQDILIHQILLLLNPFIKMKHLFTFLFLTMGFALTAQTIAVQGVLKDPKGRTVDDGYYEVVFSIYDQQADGTALWSETHPSLATKNGLFVAKLGTYEPLMIAFDTTYYLGIAIEGRVEISPRMELTLTPYALGVFGLDNQFPGVGDVRMGSGLTVEEGDVTLNEGSLALEKGDLQLDSGNLTLQGGDIILEEEGAGIHFADGTVLSTAFGGTAANLSNPNSVIVAADTDEDGVGNIQLKVRDSVHLSIENDGRVKVRKDVLLDSGQLMAKNGNDLGFGHWNPADSTYSEVMKMEASGTVVFNGPVKVNGAATADEDLVNLGTLNSYLQPNIPDTVQVPVEIPIGSAYEGGTVFANEDGYTYIAYEYTTTTRMISGYVAVWTGSDAFGEGYQNTQNLYALPNENQSNSFEYNFKNIAINGYTDWFLPSLDELIRVFDNTTLGSNYPSDYYWSSSRAGCPTSTSTSYAKTRTPAGLGSCLTATSAYRIILVRRVQITNEIIQFDDNSTLTVGALQNYLPVFTGDPAQPIGSDFGGGKVFANDDNYTYVAFYSNSSYYLGNSTAWTSGIAVGDGYSNTQSLFQTNSTENNSNYWEYYLTRQSSYTTMFNNQTDWYIPSSGELELIFENLGSSLSLTTGTYYLSSSQGTCAAGDERLYYYGGGTSYSLQGCYGSNYSSYRTVFVRRIAQETSYTADDNDFVTVGLLLNKIAELEAKIEAILLPAIGTVINGGTVFAVDGNEVYIAHEYSSSNTSFNYYISNSSTVTSTTFGTGQTNTTNILNYSSTTSTSYLEGITQQQINGYGDWFIPSRDELQAVFDNTSVATNTSSYYWTSSAAPEYSSGYYHELSPSGNSNYQYYSSSGNYLILVRKYTIGQ